MELEQSSGEQKQQPSTGETDRDTGSEGKRSSSSTATPSSAHTPSPSDGDGAPNSDSESLSIHPIFYNASIFLLIATLFQVISTTNEDAGPFDWFAGLFIPHFLSLGIDSGSTAGDDFAVAGGGPICPPDQWVDESFVTKKHTIMPKGHSSMYSPEYDPRSKETKPTLFPHCALKRWVQMKPSMKHSTCPSGQSYVTAIYPPTTTSSSKQSNEENNKIPKIIHISSPTNCIPTSTIQTLSSLSQSTHYTIYIHSHVAMDNFLFHREYKSFPQIKEGILCGMKKLEGVSVRALTELKVGNSTEQRTHVATEIGLGVKRDFWRLMILWEYGGAALDIDTLHDILVEGGDATNFTATNGGETTMRNLIKQWSMEKSDGMIYFINNVGKQRLPYNERIPSLDVMVWKPHHAFIFYSAKIALRFAVFDTDVSFVSCVPMSAIICNEGLSHGQNSLNSYSISRNQLLTLVERQGYNPSRMHCNMSTGAGKG